MRVNVRLFSLTREQAGLSQLTLELPPGSTIADCLERLRQRFPQGREVFDPQGGLCWVALNREHTQADRPVSDGDELAIFPPVSGGAPPRRATLLLSGGFDSPVAGAAGLSQGLELDAIHFSMEPFTDDASVRKARELARRLKIDHLRIVPLGPELAIIAKTCDAGSYFVLQKRLMLRLAARSAAERGAAFLITGENLGQVSSQTLPNLAAIDNASPLPVLRPLLGMDKVDIIDEAKRIGTYETSCGPEVCDVLGPRHPNTNVNAALVRQEEARLDLAALTEAAWRRSWLAPPPAAPVAARG